MVLTGTVNSQRRYANKLSKYYGNEDERQVLFPTRVVSGFHVSLTNDGSHESVLGWEFMVEISGKVFFQIIIKETCFGV